MGAKTKTVGGSGQQGKDLSSDWLASLSKLLNGQPGQVGAGNPAGGEAVGATQGVTDVLSDILGQGAGNIGGALAQLLQRTQDRDVNKLKEGFRASGGAQFGTPGAYAESMYRGEAAPNITKAIGELQLGASQNIMSLLSGVYGRETPQAENMVEPGVFDRILQSVGALSGAAQQVFTPGLSKLAGSAPSAATKSAVDATAQGLTPVSI